ncbi:MAG: orotidine-5'-phosphate decarboxylase [Planctomycetota bacterium]|nr:orotidine-5'-phosphate decarboxylase [Planctomycetota bacterium]MDA1137956.1 orotidine-5'-phosphate decarboxylase [Planctomycetota bacterium]
MPTNFADRLNALIRKKQSCSVVGIDPRLSQLPAVILGKYPNALKSLEDAADAYREFGCRIAELVAPLVPAVKPQVAFFERLGPAGMAAYADVCSAASDLGLLVIADVKRSDIGSTAQAYSDAFLGPVDGSGPPGFEADAVTVNPYLGSDGVKPFIEAAKVNGKGLFILVRTSNPSAGEFQDLKHEGKVVFEHVAEKVKEWGQELIGESGYSSIGAVVGATYPQEAAFLRALMPQTPFLVPGYGAQGGSAEDVRPSFNGDGLGAVVNASRSIIFAHSQGPWKEKFGDARWEEAVVAATKKMNDDLRPLIQSS